jgi:hypothetical protein
MQEAFDKVKQEDDEWMAKLTKDVISKLPQKNGRQR